MKRHSLLAAILIAGSLIAGLSKPSFAQTSAPPSTITVTAPPNQVPVMVAPAATSNSLPAITVNGITFTVPILNQQFTVQGQTLEVVTNSSGGLTVITFGPFGTNQTSIPHSTGDVVNSIEEDVAKNNPANISYYNTNGEWNFKVGGVYAQNTGEAGGLVDIGRYGFIPSMPNLGADAGVIEGTQNGQNGTAAEFAFLDYRKPIGDVAFAGGIGGGRDNNTDNWMGLVKGGVEYRENPHLGQFVDIVYDFEGWGGQKIQSGESIQNPSGLFFSAGFTANF